MFLSHLSKYIESLWKKFRQSFPKNLLNFSRYYTYTSGKMIIKDDGKKLRWKFYSATLIFASEKITFFPKPKFFFSSDRMKVGKNVIFSDAKIRVAEYLVFTLISRHRLLLLFFPKDMYSTKWNKNFSDFPKGKYYILICARKCRFSLMKVWKMMLLFYRGLKFLPIANMAKLNILSLKVERSKILLWWYFLASKVIISHCLCPRLKIILLSVF